MHNFLVIDKIVGKAYTFKDAHDIANYLWGKDVTEYLVVKDENRIIDIRGLSDLDLLKRALESKL